MKKLLLISIAMLLFSCSKIEEATVVNYTNPVCQQDIAASMTNAIKDRFQIDYKVGVDGFSSVLKDLHDGKYSSITYDLDKEGTQYFLEFVFSATDTGCQIVLIEQKTTQGSKNSSSKNNVSGLKSYDITCECQKKAKAE